jgi:RNA polymerase sigma-70 factor (sigma-E family)
MSTTGNLLPGCCVQEYVASRARIALSGGDNAGLSTAGDVSFEDFVAALSGRLFTMALLLTGHQRAEAEDLLQDVLERAYRRWERIIRNGDPDAYVRQMIVNGAVDRWRRARHRREEPLVIEYADFAARDRAGDIADRDLLLRMLAELPTRQRAVLVLRYFEDLTEAQTAAMLGCSVGAVKSQASRGLARLREITPSRADETPRHQGRWLRGTRNHG